MEYIKINNVMNYIPKQFRDLQKDDDQWLSWALQYLRTVNTHELVVRDFALLEVVDHKVQLPKGLKKIESIRMSHGTPTDAEIASVKQCLSFTPRDYSTSSTVSPVLEGTTEQGTSNIYYFDEACALNVQLFQASAYYNSYMKPMRYAGVTQSTFLSSSCYKQSSSYNDCYTGFSITPTGCLMTDIQEGLVCIEFTCEIKDDDGNFLVPAQPVHLWQAMAQYAIAQHWLGRTAKKEANAFSLYQNHLSMARNYMREAKSIFRQKNTSFSVLKAITRSDTRILHLPAVWNFAEQTNRIGYGRFEY